MDISQLSSAELGEKNVFEEIFELLERHRLSYDNEFPLGDFYDVVNNFDLVFQEFNSTELNTTNIQRYNTLLTHTFGNFLTIFKSKGFKKDPIFFAFKRFISFFTLIIKEANLLKTKNHLVRNFLDNFPSINDDISPFEKDAQILYTSNYGQEPTFGQSKIIKFETNFPKEIGSEETLQSEKSLTIFANNFISKTIKWQNEESAYVIIEEQFYLILDIKIDSETVSMSKLLTPLWSITSALENIENVTLELSSVSLGSINSSINVWMKNLLAKEEVKAVLETAKELTVKGLSGGNVSYTEVKKSRQEIKKLELENTKLDKELEHGTSKEEIKFGRALDIERKMLENEKLQLENAKAKIDMIEKLSDMVSRGILEADMVRIDINDILFLLKMDNKITEIGPDINEIS